MRIGLDDILERAALLADRGREAVDAHRSAVEVLDDGEQQLAIQRIEALAVDFQQIQRRGGHRLIDVAVAAHLRVVAHPAQQAVGDARRAARALRDARARRLVDRHLQDPGRARDDRSRSSMP